VKSLNSTIKIIAIISLVGFLMSFGLLEYHRSFDPYSWMETGIVSIESRNLWNERKWQYFYLGVISFVSLFLSIIFLIFNWIINRNNKVNLK
jgi:hypothetical protein